MHDITRRQSNNKRSQRKNRRNNGQLTTTQPLVERSRFSQSRVQVQKFSRVTSGPSIGIIPATGIGGSAQFDMQMAFSLSNTLTYIHGVLYSTDANPGASEFIALYDEYALESVEISCMLDLNSVNPGAAGTMSLPICSIVYDPNDSSSCALSDVLQYQDLHVVQLGNQRTPNGYVLKCKPRSGTTFLDATGSVVGSGPSSIADDWKSTKWSNILFYGVKFFFDLSGSTLATEGGTFRTYTKYNWKMKSSI